MAPNPTPPDSYFRGLSLSFALKALFDCSPPFKNATLATWKKKKMGALKIGSSVFSLFSFDSWGTGRRKRAKKHVYSTYTEQPLFPVEPTGFGKLVVVYNELHFLGEMRIIAFSRERSSGEAASFPLT